MKKRIGSSNLFLTELLLSILFFIVIVAVCLQVFAKADSLTDQSLELTQAVRLASDGAELFLAGEDTKAFSEVFTGEAGNYHCNYDRDFIKTQDSSEYQMTMAVQKGEKLDQATITVLHGDECLYELKVERLSK